MEVSYQKSNGFVVSFSRCMASLIVILEKVGQKL